MANNHLTTLPGNLFFELKLLFKIDLSGNDLFVLPPEIFYDNANIEIINLYNNKLETISEVLFNNTNLTRLDLRNNNLTKLKL